MKTYTFKNLGRVGRLGNQLWQIAGIAGQASCDGSKFYVRPSWEYKKYFSLPDFAYLKPVNGEIVDGGTEYFQDLNYWKHMSDIIHGWFQPSDLSLDIMEKRFDVKTHLPTCAIHVRRGDYLQHPDLFPFVGKTYLMNAIDKVSSLSENIVFFVFSDDIDWCKKEFLNIDKPFVFIDGVSRPVEVRDRKGEPEDQFDMFLMSHCDYHIISNSTFSWWGAFLSKSKKVFYPERWYGPGLSNIDWKLMIPDSWEAVKV